MKLLTVVLVSFFIFTGCSANDTSKDNSSTETVNKKETAKSGTVFKDNVFESDDFKYVLKDSEVVNYGVGGSSQALVIYYEFTNKSDEQAGSSSDWIFHVNAKQDAGNIVENLELGLGSLVYEISDELKDLDAVSGKEVKSGATVETVAIYQLVNDNPVTLQFSNDVFEVIGEKVYELN